MISIVHVTNPFEPSAGRTVHQLAWVQDKRLDEYLLDIFAACDQMTVSLNGMVIPADLWVGIVLRDGDSVVASPTVAGGNLLRTLASVAVLATAAVVTSGASLVVGGFALGFTGLGLGATASAIVSSAITIGGNLLISATLGASTPSAKNASSSYDPDGPKSLARSGVVIPKGYGTMRWGGNIIASFPDYEGDQQYMNALVCFGFGPARSITGLQLNGKDISSYVGVQYYTRLGANDQLPIPNFNRVVNGYPQDVQCLAGQPVVVPGTGTLTQILQVDVVFPNGVYVVTAKGNLIPAVVTYTVEYSVAGANNWQPVLVPLTTTPVVSYAANGSPLIPHYWSAVATDLPPGSGVVYALDDGPHKHGDRWTGQQTVETFAANGNHSTYQKTFQGEWQPTRTDINQVLVTRWTAGYQDFVGASRSPLYNRTNIYGLAAGKYDVRVTKFGSARLHDDAVFGDRHDPNYGEEIWIHSVNEVALIDLAYPNMILIGVRALATNQLSGANLNVTALVQHGLRSRDHNNFPGYLLNYEEDNPACVAADMMLDPLYGGGQYPGVTLANINRYIDEWVAWANLNDDLVDDGNGGSIRRHIFNGVFDNESNLWDQVGVVGRMSRAVLIPLGKDYGVMTDQPDTPVQMFTMGNIVADSFEETWLEIDSRANQVEISFADSTRYYRTDNPLVYMDPAQQDSGLVVKNVRIDGKGITVPAQAWHLARHKERSNQYLLRTGKFRCDLDAIAVRPGNVAILQHDVPQWSFGGRTLPGSTATKVLVDRSDLPFVAGTNYSLIVFHAAVQRYSGTISSFRPAVDPQGTAIGTTLVLSSFDGANRVTRAVVNGTDCVVIKANVGVVDVFLPPGFTPQVGQAYQLYDTDVLETGAVVGVNALTGMVTLQTPLSIVPQDFSNYFYGPVGSQKLVRVVDIKKTSENRATVEWIDYDPNVDVDATPIVGSTAPTKRSQPGVTNLTGSETFTRESGSYVGFASLSWTPGRDTAGVGIYGVLNTGSAANVNTNPRMLDRLTGHINSWQTEIVAGQTWTYYVVGFDKNEVYAALKTAPNVTIAAVGIATNLLLGSDFATGFTYWDVSPRAGDLLLPALPPANVVFTPGTTTTVVTPDAVTTLSNLETKTDWTSPNNGGSSATSRSGIGTSSNNPTIKSLLYTGCTARIIGHLELWFDGDGKHTVDTTRAPGYNQLLATNVATHCTTIKNLGFDVVMPNTYALGSNPNKALELYLPALQAAGLGCIINIDKGVYSAASSPIAAIRTYLLYLRNGQNGAQGAFQRANYEKYNGKYIVTYFALPTDDPAMFRQIESENTDIIFVYNNKGQAVQSSMNLFAWVQPDLAANLDGWCYSNSNVPSTRLCIPVVSPGFNDTLIRNGQPTSVWDASAAARVWPPGSPGPGPNGTTLASYFTIINKWYSTSIQPPYIQVATLNDWDEYTAVEPTPNGSPGFFGSVVNPTSGGAFVFNPAAAVGNDAVLQASGTYPYNNGAFVRTLSTTADSCSLFSVSFQMMFPSSADEAACQAFEFTLQQNLNNQLYAFSWQAELTTSGVWRTKDPNADTWNPTTIPVDTSLFAAGVYSTVTAQFRRESDNSLTHISLTINGTVHQVNRNTAGTALVGTNSVSLNFTLDSNGGNPPTPYSIHLRNITATLTTPGYSTTTTTPGTYSAGALPASTENLATYTVGAAALTAASGLYRTVLSQFIPPSKWVTGEYMMLSAYVENQASGSTALAGDQGASINCFDAAGTLVASVLCSVPMNGLAPALVRVNTPPTLIPATTATIRIAVVAQGSNLNLPPGSILTFSHLLLELCDATQTAPSEWADIDASGHILSLFTVGSSTGLRAQGSTIPTFTGQFSVAVSGTSAVISWTGLLILWPDGSITVVLDSSMTITGLTASTAYRVYPYFDLVLGMVSFVLPSGGVGTPAYATTQYNPNADAATRGDKRIPLAPQGIAFTTTSGAAAPPVSGGGGGGGTPPPPDPEPIRDPRHYYPPT